MGENYRNNLGFGGRGDDTIHLPGQLADFGNSAIEVNGGLGNDTFIPKAFEDSQEQNAVTLNGDEGGVRVVRLNGDGGDDVIAGVHKVTETSTIKGGDGMDRITSGRGITGLSVI